MKKLFSVLLLLIFGFGLTAFPEPSARFTASAAQAGDSVSAQTSGTEEKFSDQWVLSSRYIANDSAESLTFTAFGGSMGNMTATYRELLPIDKTINFTYRYTAGERSRNALRIAVLDNSGLFDGRGISPSPSNGRSAYLFQFDVDGNVWGYLYNDGVVLDPMTSVKGEWVASLTDGEEHALQIVTTPVWDNAFIGEPYVQIYLYVDGTRVFKRKVHGDLALLDQSVFTVGGFALSSHNAITDDSYLLSGFSFVDNVTDRTDMAVQAGLWTGVSTKNDKGITMTGTNSLFLKEPFPIGSTVVFELVNEKPGDSQSNLSFGFVADKNLDICNWDCYSAQTESRTPGLVVYAGQGYTRLSKYFYSEEAAHHRDSVQIEQDTTEAGQLFDRETHRFRIETQRTEGGVSFEILMDSRTFVCEMTEEEYRNGSKLYFSARTNGTAAFRFVNFHVEDLQREAAVGVMGEIYAIRQSEMFDKEAETRAAIRAARESYLALEEASKSYVTNLGYLTYLEDRYDTADFDREAGTLPSAVTAENVEAVRKRAEELAARYRSYDDFKRGMVKNFGQVRTALDAVKAYDESLIPPEDDPNQNGGGEGGGNEAEGGCGSVGRQGGMFGGILLLGAAWLCRRRRA